MKINALEIANFRGLRDVNLSFRTPITMIFGFNGAGKTSLLEAIRLAVMGNPERVNVKRDYSRLITDGGKTGVIRMLADVGEFAYVLPDGKHTSALPDLDEEIKLAIGAQRFTRQDADYRRTILFRVTKSSATPKDVLARLKRRGASDAKLEYIGPQLRSGFAAAEKFAKGKATESRGEWKGITGETYGEKKAETWQLAARPLPVSESQLQLAEDDLALARNRREEINTNLINARALSKQMADLLLTKKMLEEKAEPLERFKQKLAVDQKELAKWEGLLASAKADSGAPSPLAMQLAECLEEWCIAVTNNAILFSECSHLLEKSRSSLMTYADALKDKAIDSTTHASAQGARDSYARAVANDQRDIAAAESALEQLAALEGKLGKTPDLIAFQTQLDIATQNVQQAEKNLYALQQQNQAAANAETAEARAMAAHKDVLEWLLIADGLGPDGIQAEILAGALRPVNDCLYELSKLANWPRVQIANDLEVLADGRLYADLSDSEQWRVNCLITIMLAKLSGTHLAVMDKFDVLDMDGRSEAVDLFEALANEGAVQVIVAGTLKKRPENMPDGIDVYWLENKTLINNEGEAAVA